MLVISNFDYKVVWSLDVCESCGEFLGHCSCVVPSTWGLCWEPNDYYLHKFDLPL